MNQAPENAFERKPRTLWVKLWLQWLKKSEKYMAGQNVSANHKVQQHLAS